MQEGSHEENCSEEDHEEIITRINKTSTELKMKLEQLSKLRINCVKAQLELLKLYKPRCLEILEMLREISTPGDPFGNTIDELSLGNEPARGTLWDRDISPANNGVTSTAGTQTMELRENAPVVYANTTVITMQPGEGSRFPRRPIPIVTADWVSTPRMQLNAVSGTQFLSGVEQLEIQQVIDLPTIIGRPDAKTQYRVKVPHAETLFLAVESKSETVSQMRGWYKGFVLNVLDSCGETAFVIRKEPSWMHIPGSRQKITVESADFIGSVEKNFSLIGPSFTVYNAYKEPLCNIYGPNISGCCMYKEAQFQVISSDGSHQIATLMHQWDHFTVDYILLLTFPIETDVKLKSLLLGASFLIEYLYFEGIRRASRR